MPDQFKQPINSIVYELYFPTELQAQAFTFAPLLQPENLPALD